MATKKKTKSSKAAPVAATPKVESQVEQKAAPEKKRRMGLILFVAAVVIILGFIIIKNRSLFVVATVDGMPIWRPAFESRIVSVNGQKILDQMVNEQIILNAAAKKGVTVTPQEIDIQITEIQKTLPQGTTLEQALSGQGITLDDLKRRLLIQMLVEKMMTSEIKISDSEIDEYLTQNKDFLTATDEAGLRNEAKQAILNQKKNTEFQTIFTNLQKSAKVNRYL